MVRIKSPVLTPVTVSENVTVKSTLAALVGFGFTRVLVRTMGANGILFDCPLVVDNVLEAAHDPPFGKRYQDALEAVLP